MSAKPSFVYSLLAYRPDAVDTCRGCVMDRSSSDFQLFVACDAQVIASDWANHQFRAPKDREYASVEYTLLLNGCDENRDPCSWDCDESELDPQTGDTWASQERVHVEQLMQAELANLSREADLRAAAVKAAAQEKARVLAAQAAAAAEQAERAEYARLAEKFGKA